MQGTQPTLLPATRGAGSGITSVTIEVTDAPAVMAFIEKAGYKTTFITDKVITAIIPINFVEQLAALDEVLLLNGPVMMYLKASKQRILTGIRHGNPIHTTF